MPLKEFEPAIPAIDKWQTITISLTATGISQYTVDEIFCHSDFTLVPALQISDVVVKYSHELKVK